MTALAHSVETLQKTAPQPEAQTVSALVQAGLAQFINYPDLDHTLHGVDTDTSLPVEANLSLSLDTEYTCMTCDAAIAVEEQHIVISGVYSYRRRDKTIYDHHHLHSRCFHENELPYWDEITVSPMNKLRRGAVLDRIRQLKARHKSSSLAG